jgi:hypothetical protein
VSPAAGAGRAPLLQQHTDAPIKIALPGPYLLTRAMYVPAVSGSTYATKEDLAMTSCASCATR